MSKVKRGQTQCQRAKEKRKGKIEIRERCGGEKKRKKKEKKEKERVDKKIREKKIKKKKLKLRNVITIFSQYFHNKF